MSGKCQQVMQVMEALAPRQMAEDWDNVGLLLGDPRAAVHRILVTLDINMEVAKEAVDRQAGLIIAHHPLIFKPLKNIRFDLPHGRLIGFLIEHKIMVYAAHTNLDAASEGINDMLADRLGLKQPQVLQAGWQEKMYKLVVFVPVSHEEVVRQALGAAGAGWIGKYSHCSFRSAGIGTFLPQPGANPFIGTAGLLEQAEEYRLETIVPEKILDHVLKALLRAHPYEEVAYDIYPLLNGGRTAGLGRIGSLAEPVLLETFAGIIKRSLQIPNVKVAGDLRQMVSKVAVCGGAGASLLRQAAFKGADVLVTGDIKYHEAQEAKESGLAVIDAGHYATEALMIPHVTAILETALAKEGNRVEVVQSQVNTNPWSFV